MTEKSSVSSHQSRKTLAMPKRLLNRVLVYVGLFGIVFQLTAALYALWHGMPLQSFWLFMLLAPLLCVASGILPALQLQREPD
ncbi:hypothetical protein [Arsukibacterium indicum]|uniref:DUF2798 domain-containing protein n=1 Tax=Arsukibacterium indicum TaxID=2848612 RepID=A0ABS6MGX9_9GAMM|nr:hypothetical protein [Arsukibacterium indicum]MBV2128054.1 hypothetical protein [Arsukibacterium indicum]